MTIVTKSSLTLSNVNDGTITHTAYANSADGTDGFYIGGGANLLTGTSSDLIVDDSSNTNLGWRFENVYTDLIAGYVYTFSSEVSVLGSATSIDVRPYNPKTGMTITDSYTTFSIVDGKISGLVKPTDGYTQLLIYAGNQGNTHGNKVTFHHMKLEKGSVATPWSPAPSEAHPSYIGQYTDFNTTASTDPAKYAPWIIFKGNDGKTGDRGKSVWSYPYDRGANRVGNWWSDLKPTPTTDNPPEVGDTIIDLVGKIYQITNVVVGTAQQGGGVFDYGSMLTSVKGADGLPSYTHTAYSWSADGADRFTTVYPNLNLLTNTTFKNYTPLTNQYLSMAIKDGGVNNKPYVSVSYNNPTVNTFADVISWGFEKEYFKPSTTYTFSFYLRGNGTLRTHVYPTLIDASSANGLADGKVITPAGDGSYDWNLTSEWVRHTYTFITRSSITAKQNFLFRVFTGNSVDICLPKVEEGSVATPWMPSSSEVKTSDYPSYIGTYLDNNVESSSDYKRYQWTIFKGQDSNAYTAYSWSSDGTDRFSTTKPNLNLLDGTTKPFIMGYGIPNTTWDTTNQVSGISLPITVSANEVLPQGNNSFPYMYISGTTYTQSIYISTDAPLTGTSIKFTWFTGKYGHNQSGVDNLVKVSNNVYRATSTITWSSSNSSEIGRNADIGNLTQVFDFTKGTFLQFYKPKLELGSTATPWMPSESEAQDQWQDAIPMYVGVGEKDSQNPSDYRWQLNPRYVQASSDSGLSNKAGVDDLASVANTANDALVQAQNAVSNEDYTSWLEHDYQTTIDSMKEVSDKNKADITSIDGRQTIVEGFYDNMKVKWNFIDESFTFGEEGMFISNSQSQMAIQIASDKIVFWDNNVDVAFITGEFLNIKKGVFLESATIGNHLITKFSDGSPVTIIRYIGGDN